MFTMQEQVIKTRSYRSRILKEKLPLIHHCSSLAKTSYIERHNAILQRFSKMFHLSVDFSGNNIPKIIENDQCKFLWDFPIRTSTKVLHNKPDLIVHNKLLKATTIIEFSVPWDSNKTKK